MGEQFRGDYMNKLRGKCLTQISESKVSLDLQTSPIHINYINENLDRPKLEIMNIFKGNKNHDMPNFNENFERDDLGASTSLQGSKFSLLQKQQQQKRIKAEITLSQLKKMRAEQYKENIGSIEDNSNEAANGNKYIEMHDITMTTKNSFDHKYINEFKNSKSCPAIYKLSRQQDGSMLHEFLQKTSSAENEENVTVNLDVVKDKMNIILNESEKSLSNNSSSNNNNNNNNRDCGDIVEYCGNGAKKKLKLLNNEIMQTPSGDSLNSAGSSVSSNINQNSDISNSDNCLNLKLKINKCESTISTSTTTTTTSTSSSEESSSSISTTATIESPPLSMLENSENNDFSNCEKENTKNNNMIMLS